MSYPIEKRFKYIRKFWFQDTDGKRHTAMECCADANGHPCEVKAKRSTTRINQGRPLSHTTYHCAGCGKELDVMRGEQ